MINDAQMCLYYFCIILLKLQKCRFDDFSFDENIDDDEKSVNLHMKLNENVSRVKIKQHFTDILYTLLQDLCLL